MLEIVCANVVKRSEDNSIASSCLRGCKESVLRYEVLAAEATERSELMSTIKLYILTNNPLAACAGC